MVADSACLTLTEWCMAVTGPRPEATGYCDCSLSHTPVLHAAYA